MKSKYNLAIKFFTESKNEEQLNISYTEIENFLTAYFNFKFYFNFSIESIPQSIKEKLSDEEKYN